MKSKILSIFSVFFIFLLVSCSNKNIKPVEEVNTNKPNDNAVITDEEKEKPTPPVETPKENEEVSKPKDEEKEEEKTPIVEKRNSRIYAFNYEELVLYYYDTSIDVIDNALVGALTKEIQSNLPNDSFLALTDKIGVTSAKLDKEKSLLTVVFSDSFVDHMILGSSTESGLLSSLICTYGYNYDVDNVAIYFKDELYTSLKGDLEAGSFEVNLSDAKEYKE